MYWIGKPGQIYGMKLNANCSKEEKNGEGPGSCGGKVTDEKNSNSKDTIEPTFRSSAHIKEETRPNGNTYYKIIDSNGNLVGGVPNNKNQAEKDLNRIIRKEERLHAKSNMLETKIEPKAESNILPKSETSNNIIKVKNFSNYNFHGTDNDKNATLYNIKQKNVIISDTIKNISTQDVENILEKIPLGMIRNIKSIEITDDKKSDNPNSLGTHVRGSGTITIYGLISTPKKLENTLYHEIGHQFDNDKGYDNYASRGTAYRNAVNNDKNGFISAYAKNQPIPEKQYREDFADSVREYLKDEVKFEKNYPNRTKFIRDKLNSIKQNSIVDNYSFYQKLNYNCKDSEKSGEGKGSCGGSQSDKKDTGKSGKGDVPKSSAMNAKDIINRVQSGGKITKEEHTYITALMNGEKPKATEPVSKPVPAAIQKVPKKELVSNTKKAVEKVKAEMKAGKVSKKSVDELKQATSKLKETNPGSKLNAKEKDAISNFSGFAYVPINNMLFGKEIGLSNKQKDDLTKITDTVKDVIDKNKIAQDTVVWRGLSGQSLVEFKSMIKNKKPGDTFEYAGFMSTSPDENIAKRFTEYGTQPGKRITLKVELPAGSSAADINKYSAAKKYGEKEILIAPGFDLSISKIEKMPNGDKIYHLKYEKQVVNESKIKGTQKLNMSFPGFNTSKDLDLQLESILKSIEPDVMKAIKKLNLNKNIKQNSKYLDDVADFMKLNYNCPESEKNGSGPGSCGGKTSDSNEPIFTPASPEIEKTLYIKFNEIYNTENNKTYIKTIDDESHRINQLLANPELEKEYGSIETRQINTVINGLDKIFEDPATKIDHDIKIYRGISGNVSNQMNESMFAVGNIIEDKCFLFASGEEATAQWFTKQQKDKDGFINFVEIEVPKGTPVLFPNDLYYNNHPEVHRGGEEEQDLFRYGGDWLKEYILPRNLKIEVISVKVNEKAMSGPFRTFTWRIINEK